MSDSEQMTLIIERQTVIADRVEKIYTKIYGNGDKGLCDRMTTIEATLRTLGAAILFIGGLAGWAAFFKR